MFFLSLIEHTLRLPPHLLDLPLSECFNLYGVLKSKIWFSYFIYLGLCHGYIFCCRKR
ncbi:hypothetical protein AAG906_013054 [Vitis piasezkii]